MLTNEQTADSGNPVPSAETVETSSQEEGSVSDQFETEQEPGFDAQEEADSEGDDVAAVEGEDGQTEGKEENAEGSDTGLVEVDYGGQTYEVPPELKDALTREVDYTEKTTKLSESRQSFEAEQANFQKFVETSKAHTDALVNLQSLDNQIAQYQNIDWNAAYDQDPAQAGKLKHQYDTLVMQRQQTASGLQQAEQQRNQLQAENLQRKAAETDAVLSKDLPGWSDEMKQELGTFAVEQLGFNPAAVGRAVSVEEIKTLELAHFGFKMRQQQQQKAAKAKQPKPAKPVAKMKPKQEKRVKSSSEMTDKEWIAKRNRDLQKQGKH